MSRDYALYLKDIIDAVDWITTHTNDLDFEDFVADKKAVHAVLHNLLVIGEAARNLPESLKQRAGSVEWRKIVALRNIIAHEYFGMSEVVLWDILQTKLLPLQDVCRSLVDPS